MSFTNKQTVLNFIQTCKKNMEFSPYNAYLDRIIKPDQQLAVQKDLARLGHPEFQGEEPTWPSLYLSTQTFLKSPYHQAISFEGIHLSGVTFSTERIEAHRLFNLKSIQVDPNRSLQDYMILRAMDEPYDAGILALDGDIWMLDAPSEQATIDPIAQKAHGKVLSFGLGIGYFLYMASLNSKVSELVVVEFNPHVIELFKQHILPQFKTSIPITIIEGDAYRYFNEAFLKEFDAIFVDIYQSSDDGLIAMERLLENTLPPFESLDFWIESSCTELLPALILLSFEAFVINKPFKHADPQLNRLLKKIKKTLDWASLKDLEELKTWMYDPAMHRRILSQHLK